MKLKFFRRRLNGVVTTVAELSDPGPDGERTWTATVRLLSGDQDSRSVARELAVDKLLNLHFPNLKKTPENQDKREEIKNKRREVWNAFFEQYGKR